MNLATLPPQQPDGAGPRDILAQGQTMTSRVANAAIRPVRLTKPPPVAAGAGAVSAGVDTLLLGIRSSGFNDDFERLGVGRLAEGFVGVKDFVELEAVGNQLRGVYGLGLHGLQQHGNGDRVDQPRGDRYVV